MNKPLTWDGTVVSRDQVFRRDRGQQILIFLVQLTTIRIGDHIQLMLNLNLYLLPPNPCIYLLIYITVLGRYLFYRYCFFDTFYSCNTISSRFPFSFYFVDRTSKHLLGFYAAYTFSPTLCSCPFFPTSRTLAHLLCDVLTRAPSLAGDDVSFP